MKETELAKRLQNAELTPSAQVWAALEQRLAKKTVAWLVWVASAAGLAAAACLVFMVLFAPAADTNQKHSIAYSTEQVPAQRPANLYGDAIAPVLSGNKQSAAAPLPQKSSASTAKRTPRFANKLTKASGLGPKAGVALSSGPSILDANALKNRAQVAKKEGPIIASVLSFDTGTGPLVAVSASSLTLERTPYTQQILPDKAHFLAVALDEGPIKDTSRASSQKQIRQRNTLLHKMNRAMRWLPGGTAWPIIRFEKSEVALAFAEQNNPDPAF